MHKYPARLLRCLVDQRRMRQDRIVVIAPAGQLSPCLVQAVEDLLFDENLIARAAVKRLDERVLLQFVGIDVQMRALSSRATRAPALSSDLSTSERVSWIGTKATAKIIKARSKAAIQTPYTWPQSTKRQNRSINTCPACTIHKRSEGCPEWSQASFLG